MTRAQVNANLLFYADRLTDAQLKDLERCARALLAAKKIEDGDVCPICEGMDRKCWMRFLIGFKEHDT